MDDLVSDFVCEASEALGGLQAGVARLAVDGADSAAAAEMLRRLHGLKGLCGFAGFGRAEALIHAAESLTAALAASPASPLALDALSRTVGRLGQLFSWAADHHAEPVGEDSDLLGALERAAAGDRALPDGDTGDDVLHRSGTQAAWSGSDRRTRAPWSGLDTLARALGDQLGKRIELMVGGDDLRIAPAAAPALRSALIALVRNACDHGVEAPSERRAAAKPALSLLRLSVHRCGDGAIIEMADDGRGIDAAHIRDHCLASGRLDPIAAASMDEAQTQELIFSPGVTTAPALTALSGRGLGLELVRSALESVGGTVVVASTPGRGARFVLTLPNSAIATSAARSRVAA
ncbi:MAG TPA: ATP-binding protein [Caulobacteraceae bacterium]|jgi:two-component system chemotaxis sensor kinase CheA|nr:ATP-binding protein [Caulobacteraceae bacterium]